MGSFNKRIRRSAVVCGLLLCAAIPAHADVVTQWNLQVFTSGGAQIQRTLAMVHLAMFDALNATNPRYRAYLQLPAPPPGANGEAAAAAAARGVLVRLFPLRLRRSTRSWPCRSPGFRTAPARRPGSSTATSWHKPFTWPA
jgi:hypothetical protein